MESLGAFACFCVRRSQPRNRGWRFTPAAILAFGLARCSRAPDGARRMKPAPQVVPVPCQAPGCSHFYQPDSGIGMLPLGAGRADAHAITGLHPAGNSQRLDRASAFDGVGIPSSQSSVSPDCWLCSNAGQAKEASLEAGSRGPSSAKSITTPPRAARMSERVGPSPERSARMSLGGGASRRR